MESIFTLAFWKAALERASKSFAQGVIMAWVGSNYTSANLYDLDVKVAFGFGAGMALLSFLFSLGSAPVSQNILKTGGGPSLTAAEKLSPPAAPVESTD